MFWLAPLPHRMIRRFSMISETQQIFFYPESKHQLPDRYFEIMKSPTSIGRHPSQDIVILVDSISRAHVKLEFNGRAWVVTDLGSSNGTFLNGDRISISAIHPGDKLKLGDVGFVVSDKNPDSYVAEQNFSNSENHVISGVKILGERDLESTIVSIQEPIPGSAFYQSLDYSDDIEALKQTAKRLSAVYQMNDVLKKFENRNQAYSALTELVFESIPAERGIILELNASTGEYVPVFRYFKDTVATVDFFISDTLLNHAFNDGVAILSRNVRQDTRFSNSESIMQSDLVSVLSVPLVANHKVYSVFLLDSTQANSGFNEGDLAFVNSLATDVAVTFANQELYEENLRNARMAAMGETVSGLAHNIKNILQIARGGMELMDDAIERNSHDDIVAYWPITRRGIERMQELTLEMLNFSRTAKPNMTLISINQVLDDVAQQFVSSDGIDFKLKVDGEVGYHWVNYNNLHKALLNLLTNAVDALNSSGSVRLISERLHGCTVISVTNSGPAMSVEVRANIFKPFYTTKGSKGNGLGLSMTKKYIEDMNGTLNYTSDDDNGTTFYITLPDLENT